MVGLRPIYANKKENDGCENAGMVYVVPGIFRQLVSSLLHVVARNRLLVAEANRASKDSTLWIIRGWPKDVPCSKPNLVDGIPIPLKNMKVSWDDDILNIWEKKVQVPVTTNQKSYP